MVKNKKRETRQKYQKGMETHPTGNRVKIKAKNYKLKRSKHCKIAKKGQHPKHSTRKQRKPLIEKKNLLAKMQKEINYLQLYR